MANSASTVMVNSEWHPSAGDLFGLVEEIVESAEKNGSEKDSESHSHNHKIHHILVLACHEGTRDSEQAFGNLFAQVDYLCKRHRMAVPDRIAIQAMRRHSNHAQPLSREDLRYDLRALCLFISAVFSADIPSRLVHALPTENRPYDKERTGGRRSLRVIVQHFTDDTITALADDAHGPLTIDYTAHHLRYLHDLLREGMQLNLLGLDDQGVPALIVVEPDYLLDISRIAACFEQHGHHPLNYLVNMLKPAANSQAILLGNLAGCILDDAVNSPDSSSFATTLRRNFREKALEYTTCENFAPEPFKNDARQQATHIRQAVDTLFREFDRTKAILEPSFICERLGISGRVDLMTTDFSLLVEQKSGKNRNIETGRPEAHGSFQMEPHYVQLLLYYGVLHENFSLGFDRVNLRLLYSKYPARQGLVVVNYLQSLFREAIQVRNRIVAGSLHMAREGFGTMLPLLTPETLNTNQSRSTLYLRYKQPQLQALTAPLQHLSDLERAYFTQMMTFIYREQRVGKLGAQEGVTTGASDLWNMPLQEKLETGNIFIGLTLQAEKGKAITLSLPAGETGKALPPPNFRRGDMVYLYAYKQGEEPDVRRQILYKGHLQEIRSNRLVVALNERQPLAADGIYAIEHAPSDNTPAAIRGLYEFITSGEDRKSLLLSQRAPRKDATLQPARSYHPDYDGIVCRAKQAKDYFLLVGPPGTGKTSMALRFLVEEEMANPTAALLLLSYTNRAVDEICGMLEGTGFDYLRLGNEYSCEPCFRPRLLEQSLGESPRLGAIRQRIRETRIIAGTTSMLQAHPAIFAIKRFSLAIIDEASQILEPSLIGLLAKEQIGRFILIGDHKQLPAVVQQSAKDSRIDHPLLQAIGLSDGRQSLFERLLNWERRERREDFVGTLHKQGRMHPDIADFPNRMFYARERLQPVPLPHQEETASYPRLLFIHCRKEDNGISDKANPSEARIVAAQLKEVCLRYGESFVPQQTVGVIVPYRNQISVIRQEMEKLGIPRLEEISIDTVERYQGSQRDVIIYSFTVSHPYQLEFLTANSIVEDGHLIDRKLNVAITRARKQLILTGDETLLRRNPVFARLIDHIRQQKT